MSDDTDPPVPMIMRKERIVRHKPVEPDVPTCHFCQRRIYGVAIGWMNCEVRWCRKCDMEMRHIESMMHSAGTEA